MSINKGRIWGSGMTPKVLWEVVKHAAACAGTGGVSRQAIFELS
jgi:hypothetical protein